MQTAVKKIQAEIDKNPNNAYIQVVGQFLLQHLELHPNDARKINVDGKTIAKSLDAMQKEASKKKVGNCAVLTDQEGFAVVLKYFDIKTPAVVTPIARPTAASKAVPAARPDTAFNVSLEDFL
ncbi:hypothetical protein [Sporomusa acidovorans]|uniref:Uncharacterized protein n=1 Tax=Sporomusa acidovorans (strain ATCC 49682 / DSM 3132 / Mol) TaxID=1123286 RepID=A0ABZ3J8J1_SPOA4|nr:hypothetical protein [Sporomusa acidovorans]OZC16038.1 hypothetical protein SPACI_44040 [Sporomusa acidovorans DSM 3132]SDD88899.1 hypothetical protein SAMN04488499_100593 [Sporomusa acidovorans]